MEVALAVAAAVLLAVVIAWVLRGRRRYGRVFALDHVRAFVARVDAVRGAALDRYDAPVKMPGDPRAAVTPAGLALLYTISPEDAGYRHHLSLSHIGGPTTRAVGGPFLLLAVKRLQVPGMEVGLGVAPSGVHHAEWVLDDEAQALSVDRDPPPLDDAALAAVFAACRDEAKQVPWEQIAVEPVGQERSPG